MSPKIAAYLQPVVWPTPLRPPALLPQDGGGDPHPTHMFLSVEGFTMPTAPKPKKGKHDESVKRLLDDEYDAIQALIKLGLGLGNSTVLPKVKKTAGLPRRCTHPALSF